MAFTSLLTYTIETHKYSLSESMARPCSLRIMAPAMLIGDLFAATRSTDTRSKSGSANLLERKSFNDYKQDWAPESTMACTMNGLIEVFLRPNAT